MRLPYACALLLAAFTPTATGHALRPVTQSDRMRPELEPLVVGRCTAVNGSGDLFPIVR
jgi:hypothetical protein